LQRKNVSNEMKRATM